MHTMVDLQKTCTAEKSRSEQSHVFFLKAAAHALLAVMHVVAATAIARAYADAGQSAVVVGFIVPAAFDAALYFLWFIHLRYLLFCFLRHAFFAEMCAALLLFWQEKKPYIREAFSKKLRYWTKKFQMFLSACQKNFICNGNGSLRNDLCRTGALRPAPLHPRKLRSPCFPIRETLDYSAARPCSTKSHGGDDFEKRARLTKSKLLSLSSFSVSPCLPTFRGCVLRQYHTPLTFIVNCPFFLSQ